MADGSPMWRVLSNLLSNVCKYSQPHTRVYLTAKKEKEKIFVTMKNTSRERLNLPADELMEHFVKGDKSRCGEGSGLGLNIAKSLMELQKGVFSISIDGDLFKVQLCCTSLLPQAEYIAETKKDVILQYTNMVDKQEKNSSSLFC